jgi:hypothetical protein
MLPTNSYPPVFADPKLESDFTRDGYVVFPLLDAEEVERLKAAYAENVPELPDAFFMTGMGTDLERRKRLGESMYAVLQPALTRLMPDFTVITGRNFVVKRGADDASRMPMHQDLSFVDQNVERGVHIWIPLVDVNNENGCLKVTPGSHRLMNHIAAVGGLMTPFDGVREILEEDCTVSVPMKAGEAFFFDERLVHGSEPNKIPAVRPAANIAFVRNGTKQRVHFVNPATPGVLDVFEVGHEFAIQYTNALDHHWLDPDAVRKIGTVEYTPVPLTVEQLEPVRLRWTKTPKEAPVDELAPVAEPTLIETAVAETETLSEEFMPKMPPPAPAGFFSRLFGGRP